MTAKPADDADFCPECGSRIPDDAPLGMCAHCLASELASDLPDRTMESERAARGTGKLETYEILDQIGEGGFGIVYRARQKVPFEREVALKILRPWMGAPGVLARFEAERQALALLDHPNIASIFDAGETDDGRPWFAMEYVDAEPLTAFCRNRGLDVAGRLRVFRDVCEAVAHAHQRGIIHRDLKPSNILVSEREGEPAVKLIDFGIAKATQHVLTDSTLLTGMHQSLGTPAYMSPEQARSGGVDVDTRTDVYALGVILYELLTGESPAIRSTTSGLRTRERPSRRTLPKSERLPDDLDWIVLKAMEEEPGRRYASVADLAADLMRFERREPIEARPPSVAYRVSCFVSRHRYAVAAVLLLTATVVSGALVSLRFAIDTERARAETRRVASVSDLRAASKAAEDACFADCVAFLTRSLRTNPDNVTSFWKLAHELAYRGYIPPSELPVVLEAGIEQIAPLAAGSLLARDRHGSVWLCQTSGQRRVGSGEWIGRSEDGRYFALLEGGMARWFALEPGEGFVEMGSAAADRVFFVDGNIVLKQGTVCQSRSLTDSTEGWQTDLRREPLLMTAAGGRRIVCGHSNGWVQIFSGRSGERLGQADAGIRPRQLATDGRVVTVLTERGDLRLWNPGGSAGFVGDSVDHVRSSIAMDGGGNSVAVLRLDGSMELWRIDGEELVPVVSRIRYAGGIDRVVFDAEGTSLAAIASDGRVHVLDAATGEPTGEFVFHTRRITDAQAGPGDGELLTASESGVVHRFSLRRRSTEPELDRDLGGKIIAAGFSPVGNSVNVVEEDKTCHVWKYPEVMLDFPPFRFPGGQEALDVGERAEILMREGDRLCRMEPLKRFRRSPWIDVEGGLNVAELSTGCTQALVGTADGKAELWRLEDGVRLHSWDLFDGPVSVAAVANGQRRGAIASGGSLCIVSLEPPFEIVRRCEHGGEIGWLESDADGRILASGSTDNSACIWSFESGAQIGGPLRHAEFAGSREGADRGVFGVFSMRGKRLVTTGSPDRAARVWDTATGEAAIDPLQHDAPVTTVDISRDEQWVATGTMSGQATLWDVATGEKIAPPWWRECPVQNVGFHPNENTLLVAWSDGVCRTFPLVPEGLASEAWFLDFAECLAGRRYNGRDVLETVPVSELMRWRGDPRIHVDPGALGEFARWLLSGESPRGVAPF